ncbi:MAG: hypothetical protein M1812_005902 [Candelaria pacifica]|nr:MAG: hypothetical protein M1812_005902 [Candelaria pacifica]
MPKAITIKKIDGKPGQVYYPYDPTSLKAPKIDLTIKHRLQLVEVPEPKPKENELVVRLNAAALNHRDLFIRQHLYPGTNFDVPLLADGCGTVIATGSASLDKTWKSKRVILVPGRGWKDAPEGPETGQYAILGGTKSCPLGTLQDYICVEAEEVEEAPMHLSNAESAALPLTGLTAWRAVFTKSGNAVPGRNVLITGIGGGVALMALQFATAAGLNVFVSSGSDEKLKRARELGAQGGVNYKQEGWEKKLLEQLPSGRKYLDAVIDGAGGDIVQNATKLLKVGGVIVVYGMTISPKMPFLMNAVLKQVEVRGSTMGSRKEFSDMLGFVSKKLIHPVISRVAGQGLENLDEIDGLFEEIKSGSQFGKLVVKITKDGEGSRL